MPANSTPTKKTALVTGASRGIGRALCEELLARGFAVHGLVRTAGQAPAGVVEHVGDLRDRATIKTLMQELAPHLDWYIANAGVGAVLNPSKADTADKAAEILDINATATIYSIYALAYEWIRLGCAQGAKIGVVSSLAAGMGMPKNAVYSASKSAQLVACEGLEFDLGRNGIGVSLIQPGFIETDMSADMASRPFLITAQDAARRIIRGMERGKFRIAFPAGTAWLSWSYHLVPRFLLRPAIRWMEKRKLL
jgi:NAD(P)-dependent dehydrogenase (short-subunit alcohol dehydrogenase family)